MDKKLGNTLSEMTTLNRRQLIGGAFGIVASQSIPNSIQSIVSLVDRKSNIIISEEISQYDEDHIKGLISYMQKYPHLVPQYCREVKNFQSEFFKTQEYTPLESLSEEAVHNWVIKNYRLQAESVEKLYNKHFDSLPERIQKRIPEEIFIKPSFGEIDDYFVFLERHNKHVETSQMFSLHFELAEREFEWGYISLACEFLPRSSWNTEGVYYYVDIVMDIPGIGWLTYWVRTQDAELAFSLYDLSENEALLKAQREGSILSDGSGEKREKLKIKKQDKILEKMGVQEPQMSLEEFLMTHSANVPVKTYKLLYSGKLLQLIS